MAERARDVWVDGLIAQLTGLPQQLWQHKCAQHTSTSLTCAHVPFIVGLEYCPISRSRSAALESRWAAS